MLSQPRFLILRDLAVLLFVASIALPAFPAQNAAEKARELETVRTSIRELQQRLEKTRKKKSSSEKQLADIERLMSQTRRSLRQIGAELKDNQRQLEVLGGRKHAHAENIRQQRQRLAAEARAAYVMGRQQQVKLLLNQEQPATVSRAVAYFNYFSRARSRRIKKVRSSLEELRQLEIRIEQKTDELNAMLLTQQAETRRLAGQEKQHRIALTTLRKELADGGSKLDILKTSQLELQALVSSLQDVLADIPADSGLRQPFGSMKGKLGWPASGRITARFGTRRSGAAGLKWSGVVISAPEGETVRAVAQGRVAFADWMRGFGLLLIIDHGDSYMSLYGHNQALYKEVGEWVDTGETVATLGTSGGQNQSGLYFELRYKGRPMNPRLWCSGNPHPLAGIVPSNRKLWYGQPDFGENALNS